MTRSKIIFALFLASTAAVAQETYKCKTPGGMVYQDRPCAGVRYAPDPVPAAAPIQQAAPGAVAPAAAVRPAQTEMEQKKAYVDQRAKERRVNDLNYDIERQEESIAHSRQARDAEIAALQDRKQYANNNLAGATLEQGIATEMQAVTARHESDIAFKQGKLKQLRDELARAKKE